MSFNQIMNNDDDIVNDDTIENKNIRSEKPKKTLIKPIIKTLIKKTQPKQSKQSKSNQSTYEDNDESEPILDNVAEKYKKKTQLEHIKDLPDTYIGSIVKENASILNLVQMWKDEDSRREMIKMADMRREVLKTEIGRLSSMDDVKARIFGLTEEEVLDG